MTLAQEPNPTAARRELAQYFRTLREGRGVTLEGLGQFLNVTDAQASRLDRGVRGLSTNDVRKLSTWYGIPELDQPRLLALASESRKRAWWQKMDIRNENYRTLIGLEQAAEFIGEYGSSVIPGLLQTPEYARAAAWGGIIDPSPEDIDTAVDVRVRRQAVLRRDRPPRLWAVIDEAVLARLAGGRQVMLDQLLHLLALIDAHTATVQVIGFEYGPHPGGNSHFIIIDAGQGLPDLVYVEGLRGSAEFTNESETQRYRDVWQRLTALALDPRKSRERILKHIRLLEE